MDTRAILFESPGNVSMGTVALPDPRPTDVVTKTLVSGISVGTERWALLGKRDEIAFPNVPGYMNVGEIVEVGDEAAAVGYRKGQYIYFGKSRLPEPYGGNSWMGTHLDKGVVDVITPRANPLFFSCEPVPDGADPMDVSLASLCAVAMRGIELATVPASVRVLVVGLGILGQYAAQICRLKGARVAVADVVKDRLKTAGDHGAEWVIDSGEDDLVTRCLDIAPEGFDIVIDTSSKPEIVNQLFGVVKLFGKFVFQGWYPPPSALDLHAAHLKMPTTYFPCAFSSPAVAACMHWMRDGHLDTRSLITHLMKPDQAKETYEMILAGSENFLGIIFDWR